MNGLKVYVVAMLTLAVVFGVLWLGARWVASQCDYWFEHNYYNGKAENFLGLMLLCLLVLGVSALIWWLL